MHNTLEGSCGILNQKTYFADFQNSIKAHVGPTTFHIELNHVVDYHSKLSATIYKHYLGGGLSIHLKNIFLSIYFKIANVRPCVA